jgi:DNA-binding transcriptional LysR family regulator
MDVDTRLLRAFVAVAEEGHITRAADRLTLAQPALSKQLRRLEQLLGAELLVRGSRGTTLTATGMALLPAARDTLAAWQTAQRRVRTAARAGLPQLTVGFIANAAGDHTPAIVRRFNSLRPTLRVEMLQSDWEDPTAGLDSGASDVALLRLPIPDNEELRIQPLFEEPRLVAMPADHPLADRAELTIDDLVDEPFIAPRGPAAWRDWWLAVEHRGGRPPVIGAVVGTPDEYVQAILNGLGLSLAFASAARFYAPPGITYRPIAGLPASTVAVAHRHDTVNPAVDDFVRACKDVIARPPDNPTPQEPDNESKTPGRRSHVVSA